jgi:hypothetical protein
MHKGKNYPVCMLRYDYINSECAEQFTGGERQKSSTGMLATAVTISGFNHKGKETANSCQASSSVHNAHPRHGGIYIFLFFFVSVYIKNIYYI